MRYGTIKYAELQVDVEIENGLIQIEDAAKKLASILKCTNHILFRNYETNYLDQFVIFTMKCNNTSISFTYTPPKFVDVKYLKFFNT